MANLSKIKRDQLLNEIKTIENKYSSDTDTLNTLNKLKQEITNKKYGLVWEEHSEKVDEMLIDNIPVFTEDKKREIVSDESLPYNFLIEGDNLHALKLLEKTHKGKIDVIYIDPPYNTKNKEFIYNDTQIGIDDMYRHSKWLSFMHERLSIAKNLLSNNGCIYISIDDSEQANLKLLCDEIFSENMFVALIPWRKRTAKSDVPYGLSQDYESILCYAKPNFIAYTQSNSRRYYETSDFPEQPWRYHDLTKQTTALERPNSYFTIVNPKTGDKYPANPNATWRITEDTFDEYYKNNRIIFPGDYDFLKITKPVFRYWQSDDKKKKGITFGLTSVSTHLPSEVGMTQDGTKEITNLFGSKKFNYPKPNNLIKYLIKISTYTLNNATILDFFCGSGTTAQAVLELNKDDGGNRKFILCTNNENNICEDITYPRIKTVITGKRIDGTQYSNGIPANLKYYKTDFIPKSSNQNQTQTNQTMNPNSGINEVTLCDKLQDHIRELVQLETHHNIDDDYYKMVLTDTDLSNLISNINNYPNLKEIYISSTILLDSNQNQILHSKNVKISEIPDYYFSNELKENGELW